MSDFDDVRGADAVDAAWLTEVFHRAGLATDAEIASLTAKSIGTGQVGENVRYELTWSGDPGDAPSSVVGKFPSLDPVSRQGGVMTRTYIRETGFYRDLQPMVHIRTPHLYHLGWAPEDDHAFTLVMEDMRDSAQGDQLVGCSVEQAEAAMDQAVGLHAPTWNWVGRGIAFDDWLDLPGGAGQELLMSMLGMMWPGFEERYAGRMSAEDLAFGAEVVKKHGDLIAASVAWAETHDAWCVAHGDYRLDNMLFANTPSAPPLCVVDWQTASVGVGPTDVAYFLSGLSPDLRVDTEKELVGRYAQGLRDNGVDIGDDAVWDGYVLGSASCFFMAVFASQAVGRTERGDEMFAKMAEGSIAQARHLGLLDVV